jgi:polar amino acid transport system permease protein
MITSFGYDAILVLLRAAVWTVVLFLAAAGAGSILGFGLALARTSANRVLRLAATAWIALIESIPVLMLLFLAFYGLSVFGIQAPPLVAAIVALAINGGAFLGDIWRGSIEAVPVQQWEAASALSLSYWQKMWLIILPQAVPLSLRPTVGFLVQLIKSTSIASLIGVVELSRAGYLINNVTFQPVVVFFAVAVIYFVLCYPLSYLCRVIDRRIA